MCFLSQSGRPAAVRAHGLAAAGLGVSVRPAPVADGDPAARSRTRAAEEPRRGRRRGLRLVALRFCSSAARGEKRQKEVVGIERHRKMNRFCISCFNFFLKSYFIVQEQLCLFYCRRFSSVCERRCFGVDLPPCIFALSSGSGFQSIRHSGLRCVTFDS